MDGSSKEKAMSKTMLSNPGSVGTQEIHEMIDIVKLQKRKTKKKS